MSADLSEYRALLRSALMQRTTTSDRELLAVLTAFRGDREVFDVSHPAMRLLSDVFERLCGPLPSGVPEYMSWELAVMAMPEYADVWGSERAQGYEAAYTALLRRLGEYDLDFNPPPDDADRESEVAP